MTSNCPRSSPWTTSFEPSRSCGVRLQYWPSQPCAMPFTNAQIRTMVVLTLGVEWRMIRTKILR